MLRCILIFSNKKSVHIEFVNSNFISSSFHDNCIFLVCQPGQTNGTSFIHMCIKLVPFKYISLQLQLQDIYMYVWWEKLQCSFTAVPWDGFVLFEQMIKLHSSGVCALQWLFVLFEQMIGSQGVAGSHQWHHYAPSVTIVEIKILSKLWISFYPKVKVSGQDATWQGTMLPVSLLLLS